MAIVYPKAKYRQLSGKSKTPLTPKVITVHTMVGALGPVESYFSASGRPYSHFGTGPDGEVRQWQDLAYRAASDLYGNPYCISIENADKGAGYPAWSGSDVPRFTDDQADALVELLSWLCHRFGLPRSAIKTSCPHERGIGWHRLGVDPYRDKNCGVKWSSAYGKVCPGDKRIDQLVNEIIPRVSTPADNSSQEEEEMAQLVWYKGATGPHCYYNVGIHNKHCTTMDTVSLLRYLKVPEANTPSNPLTGAWLDAAVFVDGPLRNVPNDVNLTAIANAVDGKIEDEQITTLVNSLTAKVVAIGSVAGDGSEGDGDVSDEDIAAIASAVRDVILNEFGFLKPGQ